MAIAASPTPPEPRGKVTADFLLGTVEHADDMLAEIATGSDMANALVTARTAMAALHVKVVALRDQAKNSVSLGTLYDMASAVKDLSEAFGLFDPTTTTTIPPSSTSTTSTSSTSTFAPAACYCCCAFWVGNTFSCKELGSPQSPPDNEAFCIPYNQDFCDSNICEND